MKGSIGITIEWTICVIALIFVILRVYVRCRSSFTPSDYLLVATWILHLVGVALDTSLFVNNIAMDGIDNQVQLIALKLPISKIVQTLKTMYAGASLQYLSLWGIKATLLLLYYQLIPRNMRPLRHLLHVTSILTCVSIAVCSMLNLFWCFPVSRNWNILSKSMLCFSYSENVPYYTTLGFHLGTDILILILPFPLLRSVRVQRRQFYSIITLFSLGAICILFAIGRAALVGTHSSLSLISTISALEQGSGIIVACCPALKQLLFSNSEQVSRRRDRLRTFKLGRYPRQQQSLAVWWTTMNKRPEPAKSAASSKASVGAKSVEWEIDVEVRIDDRETRFPPGPRSDTSDISLPIQTQTYEPRRHSGTVEVVGGRGRIVSLREPEIAYLSSQSSLSPAPWNNNWNDDSHVVTGIRSIERENSIYRNLRQAYDVHLHIDH